MLKFLPSTFTGFAAVRCWVATEICSKLIRSDHLLRQLASAARSQGIRRRAWHRTTVGALLHWVGRNARTSASSPATALCRHQSPQLATSSCSSDWHNPSFTLEPKWLKPNSITLASVELAPNMFGASSQLVQSWNLAYHLACKQRTSTS